VPVAFELQNGVHDVFQDFGAGDVAFFVDVADEEGGRAGFFGEFEEGGGVFTDLGDACGA
jgi:hypothetical protein